ATLRFTSVECGPILSRAWASHRRRRNRRQPDRLGHRPTSLATTAWRGQFAGEELENPMRTRSIAHVGLACCLALLCSASGSGTPRAQGTAEPVTRDAEYRKLDALFSQLRARNVAQFAIGSPKGIDEASFTTI